MKIFIVNLKDSHERRAKLKAQLDVLGLEYEFIEAVDGRKFSESELKTVSSEVNYAFLPGEIGCALSHQKIYKKMLDENINSALILEDDVNINTNLKDVLCNICITQSEPTVILLSRANKYYARPNAKIINQYALHKTQHATTTHSYIINIKAAKSLLDNLYPIWIVADKWGLFEDLSFVKVFNVIPHPVNLSEDAQISTINVDKGNKEFESKKKRIWDELMDKRPLRAKLKHKYRRAIIPIFNKIINQGKG